MEQKPITKKQMQWKVSLGVASAILSCPSERFSGGAQSTPKAVFLFLEIEKAFQ